MNDKERTIRNANPTPEAIIAMMIWGKEYANSGCGSMDFWDKISFARKQQCIDKVNEISNLLIKEDNRSFVVHIYGGDINARITVEDFASLELVYSLLEKVKNSPGLYHKKKL